MHKPFDRTKKRQSGEMNKSDRVYFTRLIIAAVFCAIAVTLAGVRWLFDRHVVLMGDNVKALAEWSKKADFANEMLEDMFRVQQVKEAYERQGVGATEDNINEEE